jgi:hypothetical protein
LTFHGFEVGNEKLERERDLGSISLKSMFFFTSEISPKRKFEKLKKK